VRFSPESVEKEWNRGLGARLTFVLWNNGVFVSTVKAFLCVVELLRIARAWTIGFPWCGIMLLRERGCASGITLLRRERGRTKSLASDAGHVFLMELHALHDKEELDEDDEDFMDIDDDASVTSAESVGSNNNGTTSSTGKQPSLEDSCWTRGIRGSKRIRNQLVQADSVKHL